MLIKDIFEVKAENKPTGKLPPPRNPIAVAAQKRGASGAGSHQTKKYSRKVKHKKDE